MRKDLGIQRDAVNAFPKMLNVLGRSGAETTLFSDYELPAGANLQITFTDNTHPFDDFIPIGLSITVDEDVGYLTGTCATHRKYRSGGNTSLSKWSNQFNGGRPF